ncbi:MAG: MarR family transcriptional regulator [Planctomycetes bacterium]|nr:MarR family transcriptional regulator [Planctomycetota bacterium]
MSKPQRQSDTSVQDAIQQTKPFRSVGQEALIALLITTERLRWPMQNLLSSRGDLTPQQYNVLRILRGAGKQGLPTLEIAARMIERTPGITRMIDRLERKQLVQRVRAANDRRQVLVNISPEGLQLLRPLGKAVDELDEQLLDALTQRETRDLIRLLDKVRNSLS